MKLLYVKLLYVKFVYVKLLYVKFVCVMLLYVKFVCVCDEEEEAEEEEKAEEPGIQNQKQEPHTKMWGKKFLHRETFLCIITTGIAAPKPDLDAKAKKKTILKHFSKGLLK